jgi:Ferric reductase NAD binding domain
MEGYENVLMVASGFGIAAQLPFLKKLIHGYNERRLHARRIHLVWQARDIGRSSTPSNLHHKIDLTETDVAVAAQTLLNSPLDEDTLDDGWVSRMTLMNLRVSGHGA